MKDEKDRSTEGRQDGGCLSSCTLFLSFGSYSIFSWISLTEHRANLVFTAGNLAFYCSLKPKEERGEFKKKKKKTQRKTCVSKLKALLSTCLGSYKSPDGMRPSLAQSSPPSF